MRPPALPLARAPRRARGEHAPPFVSLVDRIPPSNLEAEMALLGSVLVDKEMMAAVSEIVRPSDFYASLHESIYLALYALYESGKPLDKVALAEELRSRGMLDKIGGLAYLSSLMETVPTAASAEYYAKIVREKASLRGLIHAGTRITQLGYEVRGRRSGGARRERTDRLRSRQPRQPRRVLAGVVAACSTPSTSSRSATRSAATAPASPAASPTSTITRPASKRAT